MDTSQLKQLWRKELGARRAALSPAERVRFDQLILERLYQLPEWKKFDRIGAFVALGAEPNLESIIGKRIYLPRFDNNTGAYVMAEIRDRAKDLVRGRYGIPEPRPELPAATAQELAQMLFLVPAVGCDRRGIRLGRGGGFYDRLLAGSAGSVAVIYSCQLVEQNLPAEEWDRPMDVVLTELETIPIKAGYPGRLGEGK